MLLDLDFYISDENEKLVNDSNYFILYDDNVKDKKLLLKQAEGKLVDYVFLFIKDYNESLKDIKKSLLQLQKAGVISPKCEFYLTYKVTLNLLEHEVEAVKDINNFLINKFNNELKVPNMYFHMLNNPIIFLSDTWSLEMPMRADAILNAVADEINSKNLSSYERFLSAYAWATGFTYVEESSNESPLISRSLFEVLNGNKIVCYGYSSILKALCEKIDVPTIMEDIIVIEEEVAGDITVGKHSRVIVKMNDPKYDLHGIYYSDPTQDSFKKQHGFDNKYFNFHLVPFNVSLYEHNGKITNILTDRSYKLTEKEEFALSRLLWAEGFNDNKVIDSSEYNSLKNRYNKEINNITQSLESLSKGKKVGYLSDLKLFKEQKLEALESMKEQNAKSIKEAVVLVGNTEAVNINAFNKAFKQVVPIIKPQCENVEKYADLVTYNNIVRYNNYFGDIAFKTFDSNLKQVLTRVKGYKENGTNLKDLNFLNSSEKGS